MTRRLARHWPVLVVLTIATALLLINLGRDYLWEDVALAGLATISLVYVLLWRLRRNRMTALAGAILLTTSVQFLLYARQARNYALHALLTYLLLWQFQRLRSWRGTMAIAVTGIVLFHTHAVGLATVVALGMVTCIYPPAASRRRWFLPAALIVGVYAMPWLILSRAGQARSTETVHGVVDFGERLLQFTVEYASVTPIIGVVVIGSFALWWCRRRRGSPGGDAAASEEERILVVSIAAVVATQAVAVAATHTPNDIWILGLHHTPALIPLTMTVAALLIGAIAARNRRLGVVLLLLFAVTRGAHLVPWTSWADPLVDRDPEAIVSFHVPGRWRDRLLRTTQVEFVRTLFAENRGTLTDISDFLRAHARPGDVVVTNYSWESLYFHTDCPRVPGSRAISRSIRSRGPARFLNMYLAQTASDGSSGGGRGPPTFVNRIARHCSPI